MKRQVIVLSAALSLLLTSCATTAEPTTAPETGQSAEETAPSSLVPATEETSEQPALTEFKLPAHDASKAKSHQYDYDEHATVKYDDTVQFEDGYSISIGNPRLEILYNEDREEDLLYFLADATITAIGEHFQSGSTMSFDGEGRIAGTAEIFEPGKGYSDDLAGTTDDTILTGKSKTLTLRYVVDTSEQSTVDHAPINFNVGSNHSAVFDF